MSKQLERVVAALKRVGSNPQLVAESQLQPRMRGRLKDIIGRDDLSAYVFVARCPVKRKHDITAYSNERGRTFLFDDHCSDHLDDTDELLRRLDLRLQDLYADSDPNVQSAIQLDRLGGAWRCAVALKLSFELSRRELALMMIMMRNALPTDSYVKALRTRNDHASVRDIEDALATTEGFPISDESSDFMGWNAEKEQRRTNFLHRRLTDGTTTPYVQLLLAKLIGLGCITSFNGGHSFRFHWPPSDGLLLWGAVGSFVSVALGSLSEGRANMPLNLTKSPLRWPAVEGCLTGAFAG